MGIVFQDLQDSAKRIETSDCLADCLNTEHFENTFTVIDRMTVVRLIYLYRLYRKGIITKANAIKRQKEIKETWDELSEEKLKGRIDNE